MGFEWRRVMKPKHEGPERSLEGRWTPRNAGLLLTRDVFAPWRVWRVVQMEHRVVLWRLGGMLLLAWLVLRVPSGVAAVAVWQSFLEDYDPWRQLYPVGAFGLVWESRYLSRPLVFPEEHLFRQFPGALIHFEREFMPFAAVWVALCLAASPLLLFQTRRRLNLRVMHLLRLFVYLLLPLLAFQYLVAVPAYAVMRMGWLEPGVGLAFVLMGLAACAGVVGTTWFGFWTRYARFRTPYRDAALMMLVALLTATILPLPLLAFTF